MPGAWGACMDVGGKYAGTFSGTMNMMVTSGGRAPRRRLHPASHGHNWALTFYVSAAVYLVGAILWLFIDPVTPLYQEAPATP